MVKREEKERSGAAPLVWGSAPDTPGKGGAFAIHYFKRMGVWGLPYLDPWAPAGVQGAEPPA